MNYHISVKTNSIGFEDVIEATSANQAMRFVSARLEGGLEMDSDTLVSSITVRLFTEEVKREVLFLHQILIENTKFLTRAARQSEAYSEHGVEATRQLEREYQKIQKIAVHPGGDDMRYYKKRLTAFDVTGGDLEAKLGVSMSTRISWEFGDIPEEKELEGLAYLLRATPKAVLILFGKY